MSDEEHAAKLTPDEHRARHLLLHAMLDELVADWLSHNRYARPSTSAVSELIAWSYVQTIAPSEVLSE